MSTYYHIALVAPVDCLAGNPHWDTFEALKLAGHAVEVLDPRLHPTLVQDGVLNEAELVVFREVFKPDYIAYQGESAQDILEILKSTATGCSQKPQHVVVFGYVGPNNFGDELIFHIISTQVRKRFPHAYVSLIGRNPEASLSRHGVASVTPTMKAPINTMLNGASACIFMAGIMFDEPFVLGTSGRIDLFLNPHSELAGQAAITQLAYMNNVPAYFLGIGAGPLEHEDSRMMVKVESLFGPRYLTRDENTTDLLLAAGVDAAQVETLADLAFTAEKPALSPATERKLAEAGTAPGAYLAVALRDDITLDGTFAQRVAQALDIVAERTGRTLLFLDFAPEDALIHQKVTKHMENRRNCAFYGNLTDIGEGLQVIGSAKAVCAMRLHCSILANSFGVPSVGLDYQDKVKAFYAQMGNSSSLLSLDFSPQQLAETLIAACENPEASLPDQGVLAASREKAQRAFALLFEGIDGANAAPRPQHKFSRIKAVDTLQLEEAQRRIADLERNLAQAQAEINRIHQSNTWKAGSALTALPRSLKEKASRRRR